MRPTGAHNQRFAIPLTTTATATSMKAPTVNELHGRAGYAIETVVPKNTINVLIPALSDAGASDIIELPISKIVP